MINILEATAFSYLACHISVAIFAEDEIVQSKSCVVKVMHSHISSVTVAVLGVLWVSIDSKHKALSAMKVRTWISQLLSRSIVLGSASEGINLHE